MKKKIRKGVVCTIIFFSFPMFAFATDLENTLKYQMINIQAEINIKEYKESSEKTAQIEDQIIVLNERLNQAEADKRKAQEENNPIGELNANAVIETVSGELNQAAASLIANRLQKNISSYYETYKEKLVQRDITILELNNYRLCIDLTIRNSFIEYWKAQVSELQEKYDAEEAKAVRGYSTKIAVDDLAAQLYSAQTQYEAEEMQKELELERLTAGGGVWEEFEQVEVMGIIADDFYDIFFNESMQLKFMQNEVDSYQTYSNDLEESGLDMEAAVAQLQLSQMKKSDYETELNLYVKKMVMEQEILDKSCKAKDMEIKVQLDKIRANEKLYELGKIQKTALLEAKTLLKKMEYERAQIAGKIGIVYYILQNHIEGQEI